MAGDALTYHFLARELDAALSGGRIEKIAMPEADEVFLVIRKDRQNHTLVLSAGAHCRAHITRATKENPASPTSFCMNLRKNIGGGIIKSITQEPFERILYIDILFKNELGVREDKRLICEIMGKYANIILCESGGRIIEAIRHIPLDVSTKRQVIPGMKYQIPVLDKLSPLDRDGILRLDFSFDPFGEILKNVKGLSPASITEAVFNADAWNRDAKTDGADTDGAGTDGAGTDGAGDMDVKKRIADSLAALFYDPLRPCILNPEGDNNRQTESGQTESGRQDEHEQKNGGHQKSGRQDEHEQKNTGRQKNGGHQKTDFFIRKFNSLSGQYIFFDTISAAMDGFFMQKDAAARLNSKARGLLTAAKNAQKRAGKRLAELYLRLSESQDFENERLKGELVTANIYKIKSGMTMLVTQDYYSGNTVEIPLDPLVSPAANAQRFYKKYAKKKRTVLATNEQIEKTTAEQAALDEILYSLENLTSATEIPDVHAELAQLGFIKPLRQRGREKPSLPRITQIGDFRVLVGKNNIQNDRLVKNAAGGDVWLHAKDTHGSHVIIESNRREVPLSVIAEAASLAAYYSKAKDSGKTEVDYTLIKHVSKPPAALAGRVVYTNQKTIVTTPKNITE